MYKYGHGGNANFETKGEYIDLSANINPLGFPSNVRQAIIDSIDNITQYPDNFNTKLISYISVYEDIKTGYIFCGNGASDIIFRLPKVLETKRAMVLAPTFSDYERAVNAFGGEVVYHYLKDEEEFNLTDGIYNTLENEKIDLLFLCNPNNPTGKLIDKEFLMEIIEFCSEKSIYVVVDQCFIDFVVDKEKYCVKNLLEKFENLIILKAFTKIFALAGLRLGYLLTSNKLIIEKLYENFNDWSVSNVAQAAGIACVENSEEYLKKTVSYVVKERQYIQNNLEDLGFKVFEGNANYVFFKSYESFCIKEKLDDKGIRIRHCNNYIGLDEKYYRVGISTSEVNIKFIEILKSILS